MSTEWDDDVDDFVDEVDDDPWEDVELPDGTSVSLPVVDRGDFLDQVDVIADASGGRASRYGPMIIERREYICCLGDVYFIRHDGDWGPDIDMVGRFTSRASGVAACIEQSDAFVPDCSGEPCNAWTDEDDIWDIDERDVWDPDDEDDEDDEGGGGSPVPHLSPTGRKGMSCLRRPDGRRLRVEPEREALSSRDKREAWERLCGTTITHNGVVIAGEGATDVLPAQGVWHVIPCDETSAAHLDRVISGCDRAVVNADGRSFPAVFTDGLAPMTAARVGAAFGADTIWQLDRDAVRAISTDPAVVIAEALRVR
jgi:hypothetical protein